MNLSELTNLASIVNNNEDVIVNKTMKLRDEVRDWCIGELTKIEAEEKKLLDFINENKDVFCDKCKIPLFPLFGITHILIGGLYEKSRRFTHIELDKSHIRFNGFEPYFQTASVCSWTTKVKGCFDCMNGDIEYWTRMKKCVDFRWWQLDELCKTIKDIINDRINEQKNRMDNIVKVCNEIDNEKEKVEVTISVRVC